LSNYDEISDGSITGLLNQYEMRHLFTGNLKCQRYRYGTMRGIFYFLPLDAKITYCKKVTYNCGWHCRVLNQLTFQNKDKRITVANLQVLLVEVFCTMLSKIIERELALALLSLMLCRERLINRKWYSKL